MTPKHKKTKILATIPLQIKNKQPSVCVSAGPAASSRQEVGAGRDPQDALCGDSPRPRWAGPWGTELGDAAAGRAGRADSSPGLDAPFPRQVRGRTAPGRRRRPRGLRLWAPHDHHACLALKDTKRGAPVPKEPRVDTCGEPGRSPLLTRPVSVTGPERTQKAAGKVFFFPQSLASELGARAAAPERSGAGPGRGR